MNYKRLKFACYSGSFSMSVVANLSPLLFVTFKSLYGISYSLLGLLVLINYISQLTIDLIFSFFSHKFNIPKVVKFTPILAIIGFLIYSIWPFIFENHIYVGLVIGTIIFSAASGFNEVLISPVIAAIPSDNPDQEMSKLHSVYAWGTVFVIIVSSLFLLVFKNTNWQYLSLLFVLVPLTSFIAFYKVEIPKIETPEKVSSAGNLLKNKALWLCVFAIFLGGASESIMAQWSSSYLEKALSIPKVYGDIFGVALFALTLGVGRTLYGKFGKNIEKVLLLGSLGATLCYIVAAISNIPVIGLIACGFTGLCVSMLWPGTLVVSSKRILTGGVFVYAMMAAGGDLGASIGPQLVGIITDLITANLSSIEIANNLNVTVEQLGMKTAMLLGSLFPLIGTFICLRIFKTRQN